MKLGDIALGLFMGILCGFFIVYSLQPQRPYPPFVLNILYYPWLFVILFLCIVVLYFVDERVATLLLLIFIFFVVDIFFLGREKNAILVEEKQAEETDYPINTNSASLLVGNGNGN